MKKKALKIGMFIMVLTIMSFSFVNGVSASSIDEICSSDDFGVKLITIFGTVLNVIRIAVPILLILFGTIDLVKAVIASKEDEMKKAQKLLFNRIIAGVVVFLVITVVKLVIMMVAKVTEDNTGTSIINECFTKIGW